MKNSKKYGYTIWSNMKFLIKHIHDNDRMMLPIMLISIIPPVVLQLLNVSLIKVLVDSITKGCSLKVLVLSVAVFVVLMVVVQCCDSASIAYLYPKSQKAFISFSRRIIKKSLSMDYENLESTRGRQMLELASKFVSQRYVGMGSFCFSLPNLLKCIFGIFSFGAISSFASPLVLVINIVVGIALFFLQQKYNDAMTEFRKDNNKAEYKLEYLSSGMPTENAAGKDIRVYNISGWFSPLVDSLFKDYAVIIKRFSKSQKSISFAEAVLMLLRDGLTLYILLKLCLEGKFSAGDFFLYISVVRTFSTWFQDMAFGISKIFEISDRCSEARAFLDLEDKSEDRGCEQFDGDLPYSVEFKNVSFSYDNENDAIKNISFKAQKGEKIAVVGSNGAGKTTCMKLLSGLYTPKSGSVLINGKDMQKVAHDECFNAFSALFQDSFFLPAAIIENVSMCSEEETDKERFFRALEKAGIIDKVNSLPNKEHSLLNKELFDDAVSLSGGEMQRIFLARALYKDAPIVILDEPTSALDPIAENQLYLRYNDMTKDKTSFYISHRLSSTGFCDRILFIKDGEIIEEGNHEELMAKKGEYFKMYEAQSYYYQEHGGEVSINECV